MKKFIILAAEDDENDVFLLSLALQKAGIPASIYFVTDGQFAIDYLSGVGKYADRSLYPLPHFAIFDLKMPRRNGFEALTWVREESDCKELPVMILSSSPLEHDIKKALALGATIYVEKSSQPEVVVRELKRFYTFWAPHVVVNKEIAPPSEPDKGQA